MENEKRHKHLADWIFIHNEYQRIAGPILEHIKEESKKFIGKKIDTLKGLSSKYHDAVKIDRQSIQVNPLPNTNWANVHYLHVKNSYNDLSVEISLCFSDGKNGCTYEGRSWYFGKTKDMVLESINDDCKVIQNPLDYDYELAKIKEFRRLEKEMEDAKDKISVRSDAYKFLNYENL